MTNQNTELDFDYIMYSLFLALSQQSLEYYHVSYTAEYLTYAFSTKYNTEAKKSRTRSRSSGVRWTWLCNGFFS